MEQNEMKQTALTTPTQRVRGCSGCLLRFEADTTAFSPFREGEQQSEVDTTGGSSRYNGGQEAQQ